MESNQTMPRIQIEALSFERKLKTQFEKRYWETGEPIKIYPI